MATSPIATSRPIASIFSSRFCLTLAIGGLLGGFVNAGGSGENALLIVDPSSADSLWAANHYKNARAIPDRNVLYMAPGAANYADFVAVNKPALLGELEARGIGDHIDYIVVMPGANFYVSASGYVTDNCVSVNRFGIAGAYASLYIADEVLSGVPSGLSNRYRPAGTTIRNFDSELAYQAGEPSNLPTARRYFISAMLGYTGERGNTMAEILSTVDRSVASDGTFPTGTTYFMRTTDAARSAPRHNFYPGVASNIVGLGGLASVLLDVLPLGQHDCMGVMTGWASPDIDGADMTLLPGSFADHLTSFAGRFDTSSQTKMSRWIAKGASATSGAVEEPCNYAGKFPHARLHLFYFQGLSMGEAWFRSMGFFPFQNLLYGDPLTRPFAAAPIVDLPDAPLVAVSGSMLLHPTAVATAPGANVSSVEVLIDGVLNRRLDEGQAFALQTTALFDGWHDLRVLAYDDTAGRNAGRWTGRFEVDNNGRSALAIPSALVGDQTQAFDFAVSAQGAGLKEIRLVQNGRVMAATTSNPGNLTLYGRNLGAGPVRVQVEGLYTDGSLVRGAAIELTVSETESIPASNVPVAFSFERDVLVGGTRVIELPAAFDDAQGSAIYTVLSPPGQATLVTTSNGAHQILAVGAGATGTDTLVYRVVTPSGQSADGTIRLNYRSPFNCSTPTTYCTALANSTGNSALIDFQGSGSLLANDLMLTVSGAVPIQFGLFFYGGGQTQVPLGDGLLCVSAGGVGMTRLQPASFSDPVGENFRSIDLNADPFVSGAGAVELGSTRFFQYWYRDSNGISGFNLSDGLAVEFCP